MTNTDNNIAMIESIASKVITLKDNKKAQDALIKSESENLIKQLVIVYNENKTQDIERLKGLFAKDGALNKVKSLRSMAQSIVSFFNDFPDVDLITTNDGIINKSVFNSMLDKNTITNYQRIYRDIRKHLAPIEEHNTVARKAYKIAMENLNLNADKVKLGGVAVMTQLASEVERVTSELLESIKNEQENKVIIEPSQLISLVSQVDDINVLTDIINAAQSQLETLANEVASQLVA